MILDIKDVKYHCPNLTPHPAIYDKIFYDLLGVGFNSTPQKKKFKEDELMKISKFS